MGADSSGNEGSLDFGGIVGELPESGALENCSYHWSPVDHFGSFATIATTTITTTRVSQSHYYEGEENNLKIVCINQFLIRLLNLTVVNLTANSIDQKTAHFSPVAKLEKVKI